MKRLMALLGLLLLLVTPVIAAKWYRTPNGFIMNGREYIKGRDSYCCGKASCAMQRELWAAMRASGPTLTSASRSEAYHAQAPINVAETVPQDALSEVSDSFTPMPLDAAKYAINIADPRPGDLVVDPGCGDARVLIAATQQAHAKCIGIEINPDTAIKAIRNVTSNGMNNHISITRGDARSFVYGDADVIVIYLYKDLIFELAPKLLEIKSGGRIVSYQHELPFQDQKRIDVGDHTFYLWTKP